MQKGNVMGQGAALLLVALVPLTLSAQWTAADPSIPRTRDGEPILTGPTPRRADGRPDLTGVWIADPPRLRDVSLALKPGEVISMVPWAEELFNKRKTGDLSALDPDANCLPQGVPKVNSTPLPFKIFQQPTVVVVLYEAFSWYRQFFMDGRALPKDANPQWFGYSIAKWDGDTLVVESTGFNGRAWLDQLGRPSTESLRTTERFRRVNLGRMEIEATVNDPGAYTRPWTIVQPVRLMVDTDLLELVCNENNKDLQHLKGK